MWLKSNFELCPSAVGSSWNLRTVPLALAGLSLKPAWGHQRFGQSSYPESGVLWLLWLSFFWNFFLIFQILWLLQTLSSVFSGKWDSAFLLEGQLPSTLTEACLQWGAIKRGTQPEPILLKVTFQYLSGVFYYIFSIIYSWYLWERSLLGPSWSLHLSYFSSSVRVAQKGFLCCIM